MRVAPSSSLLISDWSIAPQSSSLIGRLAAEKGISGPSSSGILSSHLVLNSTLDRIPVGGQGKQKPLPMIPISNNVYLVYNGPTPILVSLMKYCWTCSYMVYTWCSTLLYPVSLLRLGTGWEPPIRGSEMFERLLRPNLTDFFNYFCKMDIAQ